MDKIPWTLIIAKLSNTLTEADNRLLEEWLQNDLHKEIYLSVAHVWHSVQSKVRDYKIPLHQCTIRNYYGMFIFFIHRCNHSEPAVNRPAPYLHTFFRRNGHR